MSLSPVAAIIALSLAFAAAQGLSYPLLTILQQEMGLSPFFIGVSAAMTPAGILVSSILTPRLFARFGLVSLGIWSGVAVAVVYLLIWAFPLPLLWLPLRFLIGFLINFQFMVADITTLSIAPPGKKGRYVAMMVALMQVGFAIGPALLVVTGPQGFAPFGVAISGFLLCALIVFLARNRMPTTGHGEAPESMLSAFWLAPIVLLAVSVTAAFEQGALTLMPVYGAEHGRTAEEAALLLTAMIVGSVCLTPIAGFAGERFGARRSLIVAALISAVGAPFLTLAIETPYAYAYMALWGGIYYAVFCLAFTEIGERFTGPRMIAVNAATGVAWGAGGMIGTPVAGAAMGAFGPEALPMMFMLLFGGLALGAWWRGRQRGAL